MRMIVVSRCLERVGDNAVDIGEQTAFLVTGEFHEFSDASHCFCPQAPAAALDPAFGAADPEGAARRRTARSCSCRRLAARLTTSPPPVHHAHAHVRDATGRLTPHLHKREKG